MGTTGLGAHTLEDEDNPDSLRPSNFEYFTGMPGTDLISIGNGIGDGFTVPPAKPGSSHIHKHVLNHDCSWYLGFELGYAQISGFNCTQWLERQGPRRSCHHHDQGGGFSGTPHRGVESSLAAGSASAGYEPTLGRYNTNSNLLSAIQGFAIRRR